MNLNDRRKVLAEFDRLNAIAFGGRREGPLGSPAACACCKRRGEHKADCVVGKALADLVPIVPAYADRDRWLAGADR